MLQVYESNLISLRNKKRTVKEEQEKEEKKGLILGSYKVVEYLGPLMSRCSFQVSI